MMPWRCTPARVHATRLRPPSPPNRRSCNASWRSVPPRQRTCTASRGQKPSCIICIAIHHSHRLACACRARRRRSGRSCERQAVWPRIVAANRSRCNCGTQGRKSSSISKMQVLCPLIQTASDSMWWRSPTADGCWHLDLAASAGRGGLRCRNEARKSWRSFSVSRVCLPCSPSIMIPALWGARPGGISLPYWCAFCCV